MYPRFTQLENTGKCPHCLYGVMYVVELPDHIWQNYYTWCDATGIQPAPYEVAVQCTHCQVVQIDESEEA